MSSAMIYKELKEETEKESKIIECMNDILEKREDVINNIWVCESCGSSDSFDATRLFWGKRSIRCRKCCHRTELSYPEYKTLSRYLALQKMENNSE